jgi:tetratricopeptide (TPR) repeat protein
MTGRQDLFEESMQLGHSAAWDQDWDRALEFYRKALAEFPDDHDGLVSLGLAMVETGRGKEALAIYNRASKIDPNDPIPAEKCAEIFENLGQTKEAIQSRENAAELSLRRRDVEKAIENWNHIGRLSPTNLSARTRLALTSERLGRRRQAVHEYLSVAAILQKAGRVDRATEAVQRALSLVPGDPEATKSMRLLQSGDPLPEPPAPIGSTRPLRMSQVKSYLEPSEEEDVGGPLDSPIGEINPSGIELADPEEAAETQALSILAGLLFEDAEGEPEEETDEPTALGSLARGISRARGSNAAHASMLRYLGQAIDMQTHSKQPQAIKEYLRALDSGLVHPAAHYALARLYKETGDIEEAKKHYMEAIGHPELALGANLALGRMSKASGDMQEAARYLVQAMRIADSYSVGSDQSSELGQIYDSMLATQSEGDEGELSEIVDNALAFLTGPEWLSRVRNARQQLQGTGDGVEVVPIAQMLAGGGSDRVLRALQRVDDLARLEKFSSAMEEAMLALEYAPSYLPLHRRIAQIMIRTGRSEAGLGKLATIAETHRIRGEINEAADLYAAVLKYSPVDIPSRRKLIELLVQQDKHQAVLDQFLELSDLYRQLAQIDAARKTLAEALKHVQQDGADRESELKILSKMGDLDISRLDWRQGLEVFQRIRQLDSDNEEASAKIIDLNLRLGQEQQAAKELDHYLEVLVQKERGSEALELLEDLAREHPGKQTLHMRLAEAYRGAGRTADAIAQFDALGEIQLDSGDAQAAIQTIRTIIEMGPPDLEGYQELIRNLESQK